MSARRCHAQAKTCRRADSILRDDGGDALRVWVRTGEGDVRTDTSRRQTTAQAAARREDSSRSTRSATATYDKTFDDLRFEMAVGEPFRREMLTDAINALDGQQIRIRGFILPTAQKRGIKQFVLVRDNQECCFGPGAALFDCILVEMREGATAEYTIRPVAVSGKFDIKEIVGPDGRHLAIYHIDGER